MNSIVQNITSYPVECLHLFHSRCSSPNTKSDRAPCGIPARGIKDIQYSSPITSSLPNDRKDDRTLPYFPHPPSSVLLRRIDAVIQTSLICRMPEPDSLTPGYVEGRAVSHTNCMSKTETMLYVQRCRSITVHSHGTSSSRTHIFDTIPAQPNTIRESGYTHRSWLCCRAMGLCEQLGGMLSCQSVGHTSAGLRGGGRGDIFASNPDKGGKITIMTWLADEN